MPYQFAVPTRDDVGLIRPNTHQLSRIRISQARARGHIRLALRTFRLVEDAPSTNSCIQPAFSPQYHIERGECLAKATVMQPSTLGRVFRRCREIETATASDAELLDRFA